MSTGGTDASLPALVVGFFVAVTVIAVLAMMLRRRSGRQDLLGNQIREMEARAAAAASPDADARLRHAATRIAEARTLDAALPAADAAPDDVSSDATSAEPGIDRRARDATAPPDGWPGAAGQENDALADAFAWLRIVALVEAGQRDQAVDLISATMAIPVDEAEMLVDGLSDANGERRAD